MENAQFTNLPHNAIAIYDTSAGRYRVIKTTDLGNGGTPLTGNSYEQIISAGGAFTGESTNVSSYGSVTSALFTDVSGLLKMQFSPDGTNWDSSLSFAVASGVNEVHRLSVTRKYFRSVFINTSNQSPTFFRLQSLAGSQPILTSTLNSSIQTDADAIISRGVLMGQTDGGQYINVPVTSEGHLEVAIHTPRNPFGSIHVENLYPVFQSDAIYGINSQLIKTITGLGGSIVEEDSQLILSTNTGIGGNATIQSKKRLRYRPGQGCVVRYTAVFDTGVANSVQVAGVGHAEDGVYFGYSGSLFGILYSRAGRREIQTLNLTGAASVAGNVTLNLNGSVYNVPVTNSSNIFRTAYELSTGIYDGWVTESTGSNVIFLANSVGNKTNTFAISGNATATGGGFTKTRSGVALTETWIPQSSWNVDTMDGRGPSGETLNPNRGNVYQIGYQYLGYGGITFQIEHSPDGNNADFVTAHVLNYPNSFVTPSFRNPSFPFTASAYSLGSTQNLSLKTASFAGFIEGQKKLNGPQFTYTETSTAVTSSNYKALFTVENSILFKGKANQSVVNIVSLNAASKHTQPVTIFLFKNASLAGNPNFTQYSTDSSTLYDNTATVATITNNAQIIFSFSLAETGQDSFDLSEYGFEIQPGESLTVAARTSAGTAAYLSVSVNTREDQ